MAIEVEASGSSLGATVRGVSLDALDDETWRAIEEAFLAHAVLIFPGLHPSHAEQAGFGRRFGAYDPLVAKTGRVAISNVLPDGSLRGAGDPIKQILVGNEGWHTDSSYMPVSAKASLLSAEVVPPSGGETEWADMRAAWDALDEATQSRLQPLSAHHSLRYSQRRAGLLDEAGSDYHYGLDEEDAPLRPLCKRHPETGRPALFIGRHAHAIPGLSEAESEALLDDLLEAACQPPRVLQHRWEVGDLVVWDNRCVLHRARPYDPGQPRVMHHTRIAGDPRTESAGTSA